MINLDLTKLNRQAFDLKSEHWHS